MKPNVLMLTILVVLIGMIVFLVKFDRANGLFAGSVSAWRQKRVIEGQTLFLWRHIPPLWKRISAFVILCIWGLLFYAVQTFNAPNEGGFPYHIIFFPGFVVWAAFIQGLYPCRCRITDIGLWRLDGSFFGDPTGGLSQRINKERRLIFWHETASLTVTQGKIILWPEIRLKKDFFAIPASLQREMKKITLPGASEIPEIEKEIRALVESAKKGETHP